MDCIFLWSIRAAKPLGTVVVVGLGLVATTDLVEEGGVISMNTRHKLNNEWIII